MKQRLGEYFERIGRVLGRRERREAFAILATGIFSDSERKSVEPLAASAAKNARIGS
jgi:SRSO17 transposase